MKIDPEQIEVIIAHCSAEIRQSMSELVEEMGFRLRAICSSAKQLLDSGVPKPPDLIISGIELEDGEAIHALIAISNLDPTPAIVITPKESLLDVEKALKDHVMAYLVEPIDTEQIKPTIYLVLERFQQFESLKEENRDLKQALEDRKVIEKAKGLIMGRLELDESRAFRELQKQATAKRMKLAIYAKQLIAEENGR
ncbi:ANTAR domain-containing protein [Bremerella cremea]|uniref:ANTAR domain-containing protein n=1 Tax=Bremerella cremea TaxID=1031537 RepID=A0A368KK78_9BACT|nr:ANTAR domain-containing protein [Bremerella cremea]RCS41176.1 ANTAR domain-containing protein [Bremerella cremea]